MVPGNSYFEFTSIFLIFINFDFPYFDFTNFSFSRVKWDYADNLIPTQLPTLDEEMLRLLPFLHKKFHGLCVFVPTPEVSMFDLTLQLENDSG